MNIQIGDTLPAIEVSTVNAGSIKLNSLTNQTLVLYFYPKDHTPGCILESQNFRDSYEEIRSFGAEVFGVSRDSIRTHQNFIEKQQLPYDLISDSNEALCHYFDVLKEKNMYGKKLIGIERSTFVFDKKGKLQREYRKVRVKNHVEEVLQSLRDD